MLGKLWLWNCVCARGVLECRRCTGRVGARVGGIATLIVRRLRSGLSVVWRLLNDVVDGMNLVLCRKLISRLLCW